MKALIIYDDFAVAARANAMLLGASAWADEGLQWDVKPWRMDMLHPSPAGDEALAEAADTHLIVLAAGYACSLPAELIEWLHQWALRRQVQDAAIAILDGDQGGRLVAQAAPELSEFVQRHGLSLIVEPGTGATDDSAALACDLQERAVVQTATLRGILEQPTRASYRDWGINE